MPYAPGIEYRGGEYIAQGISQAGQSLAAGIQQYAKAEAERKAAKAQLETTMSAFTKQRQDAVRSKLAAKNAEMGLHPDDQENMHLFQSEFEKAGVDAWQIIGDKTMKRIISGKASTEEFLSASNAMQTYLNLEQQQKQQQMEERKLAMQEMSAMAQMKLAERGQGFEESKWRDLAEQRRLQMAGMAENLVKSQDDRKLVDTNRAAFAKATQAAQGLQPRTETIKASPLEADRKLEEGWNMTPESREAFQKWAEQPIGQPQPAPATQPAPQAAPPPAPEVDGKRLGAMRQKMMELATLEKEALASGTLQGKGAANEYRRQRETLASQAAALARPQSAPEQAATPATPVPSASDSPPIPLPSELSFTRTVQVTPEDRYNAFHKAFTEAGGTDQEVLKNQAALLGAQVKLADASAPLSVTRQDGMVITSKGSEVKDVAQDKSKQGPDLEMMMKLRERHVRLPDGTDGFARNAEEAREMGKGIAEFVSSMNGLTKLIEIAKNGNGKLDLKDRAVAGEIQKLVQGRLRILLIGPGAITAEEYKRLDELIPSPQDLTKLKDLSVLRLEEMKSLIGDYTNEWLNQTKNYAAPMRTALQAMAGETGGPAAPQPGGKRFVYQGGKLVEQK